MSAVVHWRWERLTRVVEAASWPACCIPPEHKQENGLVVDSSSYHHTDMEKLMTAESQVEFAGELALWPSESVQQRPNLHATAKHDELP